MSPVRRRSRFPRWRSEPHAFHNRPDVSALTDGPHEHHGRLHHTAPTATLRSLTKWLLSWLAPPPNAPQKNRTFPARWTWAGAQGVGDKYSESFRGARGRLSGADVRTLGSPKGQRGPPVRRSRQASYLGMRRSQVRGPGLELLEGQPRGAQREEPRGAEGPLVRTGSVRLHSAGFAGYSMGGPPIAA
jgi:hypothetical protein